MAELVDHALDFQEGLVQRAAVEVAQHDGGHGPLVLRRQCQVGTGHGDGSWHAQLPALTPSGPPARFPSGHDDFVA
ncbi:hypothetical protein GCM10017776_35390 [Streptomyces griseoluteus]|nr:hypothetical protein GCM10017776_35390 [Streptomyces griseoluteus]